MKQAARNIGVVSLIAILVSACGSDAPDTESVTSAAPAPALESMARTMPDSGGVTRVTVEARGVGGNEQVAIDRAIRLAYEQVNGKAFAAATAALDSEFYAKFGKMSVDGSAKGFADAVVTATSGAVSEFRILQSNRTEDGYEVLIEAAIEKYERPESASMLRVAFSPFRASGSTFSVGGRTVSAEDVSRMVSERLSEALLGSKRVTVLSRDFDAELNAELIRIDPDNWRNEDRVRLGQRLAADYLVVGRLDRFEYVQRSRKMRTTDRKITSWSGGAALTYEVVNVATGEVVLADSSSIELPETKPTTMGSSVDTSDILNTLVAGISNAPRRDIVQALFPVTIVDVDGDMVALSQGGDAVTEGKEYRIVLRGREVTDPQTGRVVGRLEQDCCVVRITNVTSELSYGVIVRQEMADIAAVFQPGALELRQEVSTTELAAPTPVASTVEPRQAAEQPAAATTAPEIEEPAPAEEDPNW